MRYASSAAAAAAFASSRRAIARGARRRERIGLPLSPIVYARLVEHCQSFGLKPETWIRKMLDQAELSRGGT